MNEIDCIDRFLFLGPHLIAVGSTRKLRSIEFSKFKKEVTWLVPLRASHVICSEWSRAPPDETTNQSVKFLSACSEREGPESVINSNSLHCSLNGVQATKANYTFINSKMKRWTGWNVAVWITFQSTEEKFHRKMHAILAREHSQCASLDFCIANKNEVGKKRMEERNENENENANCCWKKASNSQ